MKVRCAICKRIVKGYIPKASWEPSPLPYGHNRKEEHQYTIGLHKICPGRFLKAEDLEKIG